MTYLLLVYEFFKTGLFAIGGGLATLPFLFNMAERFPKWFTHDMLLDMIAVGESTPGPIGVNVATFAGFNAGGILGGILATFGLVLPSYIIIVIIAQFLEKFSKNETVKAVFAGIRPAATGMIAASCFTVAKAALLNLDSAISIGGAADLLKILDFQAIALFALIYFLLVKFNRHPIFYIAGAAIVGILLKL